MHIRIPFCRILGGGSFRRCYYWRVPNIVRHSLARWHFPLHGYSPVDGRGSRRQLFYFARSARALGRFSLRSSLERSASSSSRGCHRHARLWLAIPGLDTTRVSDHVSAGQAPEDSNFTAVSLSMKRQRAVEQVQYNERRTKYIRLKYERTYLVIGPHELTRRHERSETEQGKYHGQTRAGRRES